MAEYNRLKMAYDKVGRFLWTRNTAKHFAKHREKPRMYRLSARWSVKRPKASRDLPYRRMTFDEFCLYAAQKRRDLEIRPSSSADYLMKVYRRRHPIRARLGDLFDRSVQRLAYALRS